MRSKTTRTLLIIAFLLNIAFFALLLLDYTRWDARYWVPLAVAWAVVMLLSILLGLFARAEEKVVERIVERVVVQQADGTYQTVYVPTPSQPPAVAPAPVALPPAPAPAPAPAPTAPEGPFVYNGYTLHTRNVELKNGGSRPIYFFAKGRNASGRAIPKPAGYHVGVNERTGLPFLKRGEGADGEDLTPQVEKAYRPQCAALTEAGGQCRNPSREASKYCGSHFGYQPTAISKAAVARDDTKPRYKATPDTKPSRRKAAA